jgi:hypothetical protein
MEMNAGLCERKSGLADQKKMGEQKSCLVAFAVCVTAVVSRK